MTNYTNQRMSDPMWNGQCFSTIVDPMVIVPIQKDPILNNQCEFPMDRSNQWEASMQWPNEDQANGWSMSEAWDQWRTNGK